MEKLSKQLVGIAGEYYVAAELSRRNFLAAITLRNTDGADILVSSLSGEKLFSIQVKCSQNKRVWPLNQKVENEIAENKYFVFVELPFDKKKNPSYFIVKAKLLAEHVKNGHTRWLTVKGKKGQDHNDSPMRQFHYAHRNELTVYDNWDEFLETI